MGDNYLDMCLPLPPDVDMLVQHRGSWSGSSCTSSTATPASSIDTPPTAKRTVRRVLSRSEMAVQALGSRHGMAVIAVEEAVGPVESYPSRRNYDVQTLIRSKALDYNGRFVLLTWLVAEGCSPVLVVELMLAAGSLKNQAAFDHVLSMLHAISQNKFKYKA